LAPFLNQIEKMDKDSFLTDSNENLRGRDANDSMDDFSVDDVDAKAKYYEKLNDQLTKEADEIVKNTHKILQSQEEKLKKPITPILSKTFLTQPSNIEKEGIKEQRLKKHEKLLNDIEKFKNQKGEQFEDDELDIAAKQMGTEAALKFYKARCKAFEQELDALIKEVGEKEARNNENESKIRELTAQNVKMKKQFANLKIKCDKLKKNAEEAEAKYKQAQMQLQQMEKEMQGVKRQHKQTGADMQSKDIKYQRVLEEKERFRQQLNELKKERDEATDIIRRENQKLKKENAKLERQKHDLLLVFKKQRKLIDILKRQKIHIEAAKLLQFTEAEFMKTLDMGK